jgi:glycosyltransferase involved in cell wall biosynthesis
MQRKKILWLVSWYPNKNDAFDGDFIQRHARAAAIYHDVHVIFVTDCLLEQPIDEDWNYATGLTEQLIYFKKQPGFIGRLRKQWKWRVLFQKAIATYISRNGMPHLVHIHIPWKAGLIGLWIKRKYGLAYYISEHWGIYNSVFDDHFYNKPVWVQRLLSLVYKEALKLIVVSRFLGNGIEKTLAKKFDAVIPNVVDTTLFHLTEEKYSKFTFIHVSNMVSLKNVELILKAFNDLVHLIKKDVQLIMIGNRNDEYVLMAHGLGLLNRSVFFRGEISYTEVAEEVRRSHGFVLFSDSETFSCVTAEALCCGVPVIASRVGSLPELVNHENGIMVEPKNVKALTVAMKDMVDNYSSFQQNSISKKATDQYCYAAIAERFRELYDGRNDNPKPE